MIRKKEVLAVLSRILGKKFNCISRVADMLCLFLGEDHIITDTRGKQIDVAECAIHFQTQWRFRNEKGILLASRDIYEPYSENAPEDWQFDLIGRADEQSSVFDVRAKVLMLKMQAAVVTDCCLSPVNDLCITFSNGVIFEQFTPTSQKNEEWRLIDYKNHVHFVCYGENGSVLQE